MAQTENLTAGSIIAHPDYGRIITEMIDGDQAVIHTGTQRMIRPTEEVVKGERIDNDLGRRRFSNVARIKANPNDNQLFEMIFQQALEITKRYIVPFEVFDALGDSELEQKRNATSLDEAVGYWHLANAFFDAEEDEQGEKQFFIRVNLIGELFVPDLFSYLGDDVDMENTSFNDYFVVKPRFRPVMDNEDSPFSLRFGDDEEGQKSIIDFDLDRSGMSHGTK